MRSIYDLELAMRDLEDEGASPQEAATVLLEAYRSLARSLGSPHESHVALALAKTFERIEGRRAGARTMTGPLQADECFSGSCGRCKSCRRRIAEDVNAGTRPPKCSYCYDGARSPEGNGGCPACGGAGHAY